MGLVSNERRSSMEIPVLIEPVAGNGYRARCGEPLPLTAEGTTRDEALANLRRLIDQRVADGAEVAALSVPGKDAANPWVGFAGMFKDDPYFGEVIDIMAENRRKMDADPDVP
jgi:predicted RNase H-like HicB family nuclease